MPAFHEVTFPLDIALGASGGPERRNEIVTLTSGSERRNLRFARSTDGGHTFEPAIFVNDDALGLPSSHTFHDIAVADDGAIYVSWIDGRERARVEAERKASGAAHGGHGGHASHGMHDPTLPGSEVRVARSTDGGRSWRTGRYPALLLLHLAWLWLPLALILAGLAQTPWAGLDMATALHAVTMGAMGTMMLAIMGRAAMPRRGGRLAVSRPLALAFGLVSLATLLRLLMGCVAMAGPATLLHLAASGWMAGWALFLWDFRHALQGPVPRPVLSASSRATGGPGGRCGSMRPGRAAVGGEILAIAAGADVRGAGVRLDHLVIQPMFARVILGLLAGLEAQADLALGVVAAGPAHQRVDLARIGGRKVQHPVLGAGGARLHGVAGGLVDADAHGGNPLFLLPALSPKPAGRSRCTSRDFPPSRPDCRPGMAHIPRPGLYWGANAPD